MTQKYIWSEECAKAHAPGLIPLGLRMLAPVLFKYGTQEQKDDYLPRMLSGEHFWCQGYSEPGPDYAETVTPRHLNVRAASVYAGAKEVQKNIIAKTVLGL